MYTPYTLYYFEMYLPTRSILIVSSLASYNLLVTHHSVFDYLWCVRVEHVEGAEEALELP